jgi:hypothetical protein
MSANRILDRLAHIARVSLAILTALPFSLGGTLTYATPPDISNNAGSCQELFCIFLFSLFFFRAHNSIHSEEWSYWFR